MRVRDRKLAAPVLLLFSDYARCGCKAESIRLVHSLRSSICSASVGVVLGISVGVLRPLSQDGPPPPLRMARNSAFLRAHSAWEASGAGGSAVGLDDSLGIGTAGMKSDSTAGGAWSISAAAIFCVFAGVPVLRLNPLCDLDASVVLGRGRVPIQAVA